jgi:hypothetical protein
MFITSAVPIFSSISSGYSPNRGSLPQRPEPSTTKKGQPVHRLTMSDPFIPK